MEHHARLELARVVSQIGEERLRVHEPVPVHGAEKQRHGGLQLADHLGEVVATVPVQDHELGDALTGQRGGQDAQHQRLGAGVQVQAQRDVELPGVDAERHQGEHDDPRSPLPRASRRQRRDPLGCDVVGRVGQVEVMRFGRTPRQQRDVVARVAHGLPGQLVQDVGARRHRVSLGTGTPDSSTLGLTPPTRRPIKWPMTSEDAAAQLARERALKQAEKMETIGRLTGAIAQQFNELLTAILARAAALAQSGPPSKDLDTLKETAQRGAELAQRLLGFSRHRVLDLQPLVLTEFVRDALDAMGRGLPGGVEVQFEVDEDAGVIEADPAAVKQILLHLVTNARDAMPRGGTLHVEVRRARLGAEDRPLHAWVEPGSYVSVALSDTGVGMDARTLARVFEPFFTTKAVDGQNGLDAYRTHRATLNLVITDVVMPKLSGFDLYQAIRGESRGVRVLFMSGFPAPNFRKTVGQDPRVAFVTKPWTASELLAQVRLLLEAPHA